ncbi:NHL repeat-containing protein [Humisphaera borealis]|uniref:SMP-30/Gluconolactonase/LRE-like region domain-containing protein n=1 Tax=Humisphaera borealis TaxID=2807512 RepID=A0A7M2WQ97_9BACT|nr:hypothetical protein [Humisphaera borealis]QOV87705.1 hypothetical protein IPV69_15585 [Humisphaera borealis]
MSASRLRLFVAGMIASFAVHAPFFTARVVTANAPATLPAPGFHAGRIAAKAITESSGLIASRAHPGVYWTHNDSGSPAEIFAIDATGKLLRTYAVAAKNIDWEDIAIDDAGTLYIADTGNNRRDRREVYVHAVAEPDPAKDAGAAALRVKTTWSLRYPGDKPFDAECLFVVGGKGYVVSKLLNLGQAGLYRFDIDPAKPRQVLEAVGVLPIRFPVTAGDVSADGKWLGINSVAGPYLFRIDGDVMKAPKVEPKRVTFASPKMEACTFTTEGLLATTEDNDLFLFRWKDFGVDPK